MHPHTFRLPLLPLPLPCPVPHLRLSTCAPLAKESKQIHWWELFTFLVSLLCLHRQLSLAICRHDPPRRHLVQVFLFFFSHLDSSSFQSLVFICRFLPSLPFSFLSLCFHFVSHLCFGFLFLFHWSAVFFCVSPASFHCLKIFSLAFWTLIVPVKINRKHLRDAHYVQSSCVTKENSFVIKLGSFY